MQRITWKKIKDGYMTIEPESDAKIKVSSFVPLEENQLNKVYETLIHDAKPLDKGGSYEWLIPPGLLQ